MSCDPKARALKVLPISPAERERGRYIHTQKQKIFVPTTLAGILVVVVVKKYVEGGEVRKK